MPQPRYVELLAVILLGASHVVIEVAFSLRATRIFNAAVLSVCFVYLVWRVWTTEGLLYRWGFRADNFWIAFRSHLPFFSGATAILFLWGGIRGSISLPPPFWIAALLYPLFGVAQQFVLQNLLMANLRSFVSQQSLCAFLSAFLFALSHLPRWKLAAVAFVAGFFLVLAYQRRPNLWAVGIIHGLLASLAFYLVLDETPGARALQLINELA